jgi:16S rRNA (guanine527-N7)-methyltransferase
VRAEGDDVVATYVEMVRRYHRTLDLMSDRGLADIDRLVADAEAYARAVRRVAPQGVIVDVGTGAGLPAVVVAARVPGCRMLWVERRQRRATFLRMVAAQCALARVAVHAADVRAVTSDDLPGPLAAVTAQAVAGWAELYGWTRHLHGEAVTLVARRGGDWEAEVRAFAERLQAEVEVGGAAPLGGGGTLVVLLCRGGLPCP